MKNKRRPPRHKLSMAKVMTFILKNGRLPVRDRYWKRTDGRLRIRYALAAYTGFSGIASFSALSLFPLLSAPIEQAALQVAQSFPTLSIARNAEPVPAATQAVLKQTTEQVVGILNIYRDQVGQIRRSAETRANVAMVHDSEQRDRPPTEQHLTIAAGDTLSTLLVQAGFSSEEAGSAIKAMRTHIQPGDLRPGQVMNLESSITGDVPQLNRLTLAVDPVRTLEVKRNWSGYMTASMIEKPLKRDIGANVAVIKGSLYGAAAAAGVPNSVTAEAIKALGHQIDFQRDLKSGDRLEIMYDRLVTNEGYVARTGGLIFARLYADDREMTIYRFETRDGRVDYFDQRGNSIRKALLRTPMDGARVTSGFGMRRHPVLGYSKMHKGIDFGASIGTPVYAAGDAIVEKAGPFSSYGNYVRLKHNSTLKTAYAHLSRFGPGVRPGTRVRQGQVIGYVGNTGRSTGPHLHYEILMNDRQVNPQSVKLPTMVALDGRDLKKFQEHVARLDRQFKERTQGIRYASSDQSVENSDPSAATVLQ